MRVSIFGTGYVGLVTGACFAEVGNDVICVDVNADKIEQLNRGEMPIYEPGLESMVARNRAEGRLQFTTDAQAAVQHGEFQFIAVGTPPDEDGSADLRHVLSVADTIATWMDDERVIVDKSTVPVGTADRVREAVGRRLHERGARVPYAVVSNPEFLKEGAAIDDFMKPERVIVGCDDAVAREKLHSLYAPFNRNHDRLISMDVRSAELTKYAANAMLATKISFMNELANIADRVGADIERVRIGIGADPRIGYHFIYPGAGYGGSCFPKDVQALARTAHDVDYVPQLLQAVEEVNDRQKHYLFNRLREHFGGDLAGRRFALWGLAFKPNTDDMREAASRRLMESLWEAGAAVQAFDPKAMDEARRLYGDRPGFTLCDSPEAALEGCDALVILTEWNQFRSPDFDLIRARLNEPVIVDGRNLYDPAVLAGLGFHYYAIGRPPVVPGNAGELA
ncbi:UDP-glucose/GDP-mannose dehydrogenase family protein [Spiribacter aquaticus]|uniref:UDP-glucose 6-dehydrogenase n=1 Tax=Spiribacter aquaticus TaxID=1935996 RepID=A0A557RGU5_9GAMM|nr:MULTISPECIES: UDP-glucose/GDP-mannose dehydrogenase family protein [Spiribacter]KAF0280869.1 UDP-glucose 6-dehydrogenase [Spiribacter roseus]TVO64373.1 UDP-glucose/GDP-mannose dehydrogenase family protein [Spiribacter aquaticus]